ncbi:MAG: hypothetical protein RML93_06760 [Anaerolineales bacterium]|nr:hypothetical protein [Anaerolineales bacterium]MCS7247855.1 hypothetical protein [Anaerolineales bacterium]MDW8161665.1 hypothetical protein [Anaerolineales bacterium]MDW8446977.1 hypothetical protein [Anaerolineales bacterium]
MDISLLILLAIICVAIAVLIGFLLATVLWGRFPEPPPQARKAGLDRRISFYTDEKFQALVIQMDGRTLDSPDLLTEEESRQLLLLDQVLRKWLDQEALPLAEAAGTSRQAQPSGSSQPGAEVSQPSPARERLSLLVESSGAAVGAAEKLPAKRGLADWLAQALQPKSSASGPPKSIAMQVDEILQRKLQERGWQQRGIRLMELPHKGMVVLVGLDQYATVEEVPDPEIRALIRASVEEWEAKMYRG